MSKLRIENPFDNSLLSEVECDTADSIKIKLTNLRGGLEAWKKLNIKTRIQIIDTFSRKVSDKEVELSLLLSKEVGKPLYEAKKEIQDSISRIKFFIDNSEKWLETELLNDYNNLQEFVVYEPLGLTCVISAWNYPYIVGFNIFIPSLIAGNSVAYKPSEYSTLTGLEITKLLYESGVPENVFQTIVGDGQVGDMLLDFPLDAVFFTGTYETGVFIAKKIAPKLIFTQLELGGNDPLYISDDIENIQDTIQLAVDGTFYNNGQSCCAVKRIYLHKNIYEQFIKEFNSRVEALTLGNPLDSKTQIGPLTRKQQADLLNSQVKDAVDKGAILLTGGKEKRGTNFYLPTILTNTKHDMRIMREESFGPIVGIMKVENDSEAISLMKDSEFGLTASVFCNDHLRAMNILQQMETGTVYLNCCDRVSDVSPWSGRKHSGLTPNHSNQTIRSFVQTKAFYISKS